jgi:hypothetical protein
MPLVKCETITTRHTKAFMYLFKKQHLLTAGLVLTLTACGGDGGTAAETVSADVFDGAAVDCLVQSNGATATEVGDGVYTFDAVLTEGAFTTASGCKDSDTQALLPNLSGVIQSGAVVISPITTLIVEAAIAKEVAAGGNSADLRAGVIPISVTDLEVAKGLVVTNLGLGDYQPMDPKTANYITAAKADLTGSGIAAAAMRSSLAISSMLKSLEISAGSANANVAVSAVSQAIAESASVVDFTQPTHSKLVLATAQSIAPAVATSIQAATDVIAASVALISGATGPITIAIAATTTVAEFLNTADATTISDQAEIVALTTDVEASILVAVEAGVPVCGLGSAILGGCAL